MRRIATYVLVGALALAAAVVTTGPTTAVAPTAWNGLVLGDGFEYGLGDWAQTTSSAKLPGWHRVGLVPHSGAFAAHLDGPGGLADQSLMTPMLPLGTAGTLSFWHRFNFERSQGTNWDGGVLEYTTDDVTWQDLDPSLYSGTITDTSGNPLGGRQGWVGLQSSYTQVTIDLSPLAGQTVRFRWRFGADESTGSPGWWLDDVSITDTAPNPAVLPDAPTSVAAAWTSDSSVAVTFAPAGGSPSRPVVAHLATCSSNDGGLPRTSVTRQTEVEVHGLTANATYACSVQGWTTAGVGTASAPVTPTPGPQPARAQTAERAGSSTASQATPQSASTSAVSTVAPASGATDLDVSGSGYFDALGASRAHRSPTAQQRAALTALTRAGSTDQLQEHLGVPTTLWVGDPGAVAQGSRGERPDVAAARGHLERIAAAYRLTGRDVAAARTVGFQDLGRGAVIVSFGQDVDGIPVWHERLNIVMNRNLGLVGATGYLLPAQVSDGSFRLTSRDALATAYADLTGHAPDGFTPAARRGGYDRFTGSGLLSPARATKVMYRLPDGLVAAWYVELRVDVDGGHREFSYVVAASDGRLLNRTDLVTDDNADFHYRGWVDPATGIPYDGPQGSTAAPHPTGTPDGYQAPNLAPGLVQGPLTGDPWLALGATVTTGNNVDAYTDISAPDGFTPSSSDMRGAISSAGNFDHVYDLTQAPNANADQANAALAQLFYDVNYLHDWFYLSGFDEAAGDAQTDNYGRGGTGGDPIHAEDMDNYPGSLNNANMSTPADGASPRMQMYVWTGPTPAGLEATPGGTYPVGLAAFGPTAFDTTAPIVVMTDTGTSTTDGCGAATNSGAVSGKIALVDRGVCPYVQKAQNAQAAGAVGLVIANNAPGTAPAMGCTNPCPAVSIGTLSVSQADGATIKTNLGSGTVTGHLFRSAAVQRDGALDGGVVAHEWGHYLAHRLAPSLGNYQAQAMGEGWSDFVALLQMVQPDDVANLSGAYPLGAFDSASITYPQQFYFGIRRMPYSTDFTKNALTFKHISNSSALPTGIPIALNGAANSEVHNAGEIWASMLWQCYAALLADTTGGAPRLTFAQAKKRMTDYLVDSLKVTPPDPTYTEARDALLMTAYGSDQADFLDFLGAFATRGIGIGAVSPARDSSTFDGVTESYSSTTTPPVAVISLSGGTPGNDGWYTSPPAASVSGTSGLTIHNLRCVLDDPTHAVLGDLPDECDYAQPGAHLPEGVHALHAAAKDVLDQVSDVVTELVKVDSTPPTVTCAPADFYTGQPDAVAGATVSDDGSGPAAASVTQAVDTSVSADSSVHLTGHDVAGNATGADCPYTVTDDLTPPTVGIGSNAGTYAHGTVTVTATASDANGIDRVTFLVDDGSVVVPTDVLTAPYQLPLDTTLLADGQHTVTATGVDLPGNHSTPVGLSLTVDNHAPGKPALTALTPFTTGASALLKFSATDAGSGIASYAVQVRKASYTATGLPSTWSNLATVSGTSFTADSLVKGTTFCFRVLAKDKAGNTGLPSAQTCTARLVDDPALTHSAGWSKVTGAAFYGGSASKTVKANASLKLGSFHGSRLALRATTCSTCGSVNVFVGTTLVKTISLVSATRHTAALISFALPAPKAGTVKIVTRSTKAVTIDGLGVSHA